MIDARFLLVGSISADAVTEYSLRVCDNWPSIKEVPDIDVKDYGMKFYNKLLKLVTGT